MDAENEKRWDNLDETLNGMLMTSHHRSVYVVKHVRLLWYCLGAMAVVVILLCVKAVQ